jgi:hypothetical protein
LRPYKTRNPTGWRPKPAPQRLYIYQSQGHQGRAIDDNTEQFVDATRMGSAD